LNSPHRSLAQSFARKALIETNRGLLLDAVVFIINLLLMRRLIGYALELIHAASAGDRLARLALALAGVAMWTLPAAGAVLKRWHFHQRTKQANKPFEDSGLAGCLFNPVFSFCLNLVLVLAILIAVGHFVLGEELLRNGAVFLPIVFAGLAFTILQTVLIYRYFTPPQRPPRFDFLTERKSESIGDVCIFVSMILYQVVWNLLSFEGVSRPSGPAEFVGRLMFLIFIALLIYFPPRIFYLAEDIDRPRTWLTMLLANSPVIVRLLV
jgi:hypothetical protein